MHSDLVSSARPQRSPGGSKLEQETFHLWLALLEATTKDSFVHKANGTFLEKKIHFGSAFCNQFFCLEQSLFWETLWSRRCSFILLSNLLANHLGQGFSILNSPLERVAPSLTGHPKPELWGAPYPQTLVYYVTSAFLDRLHSRWPWVLHCVSSGSLHTEAGDNNWSLADTPGMGTICPSPIRTKAISGTLGITKEIVYFPGPQSHANSSLQKCLFIVITLQYQVK